MEPEFIFRDTAFKHKLDKADIRCAFETARFYYLFEDEETP
jgi:hypothetical protein